MFRRDRGIAGRLPVVLIAVLLRGSGFAADRVPEDGFYPGWTKSGPLLEFRDQDLFNHIDGGAELFHEYGFRTLLVQRYARGEEELGLEIYRMASPESALGIYMAKKGKETPWPEVQARNTGNRMQLTALKGDRFIQVQNYSGSGESVPAMTSLMNNMLAAVPDSLPRDLLAQLPEGERAEGSEAIVRGPYGLEPVFTFGSGDVFQLKGEVFGVLADYRDANGRLFTQIRFLYPDTSRSRKAFRNVTENLDAYLSVVTETENDLIFRDYEDRYGRITQNGSRIDARIHLHDRPAEAAGPR